MVYESSIGIMREYWQMFVNHQFDIQTGKVSIEWEIYLYIVSV